MVSSVFCNFFSFREVKFFNSHHSNLSTGISDNHIGYIKKGNVDIFTENETIHLKEGDVFFLPKGLKYHSYWKGKHEISFITYAFTNNFGINFDTNKVQKFETTPKILELINSIPTNKSTNHYSIGMFFLLLHELSKFTNTSTKSKEELLVERAKKYIQEHPSAHMPEVANYCNVCESGLYILFNKYSDITPSKFKMNIKLDNALNYLISTDMPIEKISDLCGFSSTSYFRKMFFERYKKTPRDIRKSRSI